MFSTPEPIEWEPIAEWRDDQVSHAAAIALHHLFDRHGAAPAPGDALPPLWHWLAFPPQARQSQLGNDGHPQVGAFLPPASLPQRMFGGGRLEVLGEAAVARPMTRRGEVVGLRDTTGRSGPLRFVTVRYEFVTGGELALVEEQDLVYRDGMSGRPNNVAPDTRDWAWGWDLSVDPVLLFRFSALTYNAHRIHYDRDFATQVEGHGGLVVHGPLQALALLELVRRHEPDRRIRRFTFLSRRAVYDDGPLLLRGAPNDNGRVILASLDCVGRLAMEAEVVFEVRSDALDP